MSDPQSSDLPLQVISRDQNPSGAKPRRLRFRRGYLLVLLVPMFMFSGAVLGMYFQPTGLQKFYALTGLQPGGGSASPIALPPEIVLPKEMAETMQPTDVVGLARLMPQGDVSIVAAPYGAGDARIAGILVAVGDRVEKGAILARLDNEDQLESAVLIAQANVAVRGAALIQTRAAVLNSQDEASAALEQAHSAAAEAASNL
ncbi:MAG: biotin/lipoyl-binding protein, partial [Paracoccaceae bacterium]|nr:biotin/lipoyl-binding protein [Paracoccaceae bacterium]